MTDPSHRVSRHHRPRRASVLLLGLPLVLGACATAAPVARPQTAPQAPATPAPKAGEPPATLPPLTTDDASVSARMEALKGRRAEHPDDVETALLLAETAEIHGRLLRESGQPSAQIFELGAQAADDAAKRLRTSEKADPGSLARARCLHARNSLGWSRQRGYVEQVDTERALRATFQSLLEDPVQGRAARRAFADMLARALRPAERDLARAKAIFEELIAEDPWDLHTRLLFARAYAVNAQDRQIYEAQLKEIVDRTGSEQGVPIERHIAARAATQEMRLAPSLFE